MSTRPSTPAADQYETGPSTQTVALVTGANSGIGCATVIALLGRGASVVATVRTQKAEDALRQQLLDADVATGELTIEHLEVSDAEAAQRIVDMHRPDVVVNNAGSAGLGAVRDVSDDDALRQFAELVVAPVRLARLASVHQIERGGGRIVNVSSVLSEAQIPFTGWYGAAKAALESVSDTLRIELAPAGIEVVTVQCGAVDTDAWETAGDEVRSGTDSLTADARRRWDELTALARPHFAPPAEVAEVIATAALDPRPRPVYRVGFGSALGPATRFAPRWLGDAVARHVLGLNDEKEQEVNGSENRITIETDRRHVFETLVDPSTYPQWLVGSQMIRAVDPDWPAEHSKFHHRIGVGPATVPGSTSVLELEQDTVLELGAGMGPFGEARVRFTLESDGDTTVVTVEEEPRHGPIRAAWKVLRPAVRMGLWGRNAVSLNSLRDVVLDRLDE